MNTLGFMDESRNIGTGLFMAAAAGIRATNAGQARVFIVQGSLRREIVGTVNLQLEQGQTFTREIHPPSSGSAPWDFTMEVTTPGVLLFREGASTGFPRNHTSGTIDAGDSIRDANFILRTDSGTCTPPIAGCPSGQHWDSTACQCVDDTLPPPPIPLDLGTAVIAVGLLAGLVFVFSPGTFGKITRMVKIPKI